MSEKPIILADPHGRLETVDPSEAQRAINEGGYTVPDPIQIQAADEKAKYGTLPQKVLTGVEGAVSASTFGLIPGFGSDKDILKRKEINPTPHFIGEMGALLTPIPGTAEYEGAVKAGKEAENLLRAGKIEKSAAQPIIQSGKEAINPLSAQSIMSGLGERAARSMGIPTEGIMGGAANEAVKAAVAGSLFQTGDEISKMMINDPDQSIQTAATNIGLSGLLTGAIGGPLGGASALWDSTMGGKAGQFLEDFKGRVKEHMDNPNPVETLHGELQNYYDNVRSIADEVYGPKGLKAQEIEKLVPKDLPQKVIQQASDISDKVKYDLDIMMNKPHRFSPRLTANLQDDFRGFQDDLVEANNASGFFNALQNLKQKLQEYSKYDKFIKPSDEAYGFVQKVKSLASDLRTSLEDSSVWGEAAERQKDINKAFRDYLPTLKDFEKRFTTVVNEERVIDPGKINTYVNQLGKPNAEIKQAQLKNFLDASEKYLKVIDKTHTNLGIESPFTPTSLVSAKSSLKDLTAGARLADVFVKKGLSRLAGEAAGLSVGATLGHGLGSGFLGALIGEHALGPFFSSIMPSLIKPILENPSSGSAFKSAVEVGMSVVKGENIVNRATKNIFQVGKEIVPSHLIPTDKRIKKLQKSLDDLQTNPVPLMEKASTYGHYLGGHEIAATKAAMNSVNYLNQLKPVKIKMNPLDKDFEPSEVEKSVYHRVLTIAEQPLMVLEHIKNGTLLAQDVSVLKSIYPSLYQKYVIKLTNGMIESVHKDRTIPYKTRMSLSLFFGRPLDSTLTPEAIQSAQISNNTQLSNEQQQQPDQRPKHSMVALNKLAPMYSTPGQSAEAKRIMK